MTMLPYDQARQIVAATVPNHVVYKDGMYRVFDKAGRFRVSFATPNAANAYIEQRTAGHRTAASQKARTS